MIDALQLVQLLPLGQRPRHGLVLAPEPEPSGFLIGCPDFELEEQTMPAAKGS